MEKQTGKVALRGGIKNVIPGRADGASRNDGEE
jgi:hypothetical protein